MSKKFPRYNSHKLKKLSKSWRSPRGLHNKVRLAHRGYVGKVSIGHGTAKTGVATLVKNISELLLLKSGSKILISSKLGLKKKIEIVKKAQEMKIIITNVKDDFIKKTEENIKVKKELKVAKLKKKEQKQKEIKEKSKKEKEAIPSKEPSAVEKTDVLEEQKKDEEKKEKDKLLTRKEGI